MAETETTTMTLGGRALNPDGSLALMPEDLTHGLSYDLENLLALLQATRMAVGDDDFPDGHHDRDSRAVSLLVLAESALLSSINRMSPYV